ncbi:MAG: hypothetical protein M3Z36_06755, partial [Acidobacteriota bacterium]|nr:hypothetical protein [Acidobacteriota bacterium]
PPNRGGTINFGAIGFPELSNVTTISAGTYTLWYVDELSGPAVLSVPSPVNDGQTEIELSTAGTSGANSFIQVGPEIMLVEEVLNEGMGYRVKRGVKNTVASNHDAGSPVYGFNHKIVIVPFIRNFFGSPASGSWIYPFYMPNVRIASVELFVSNSQGNSPTTTLSFTGTIDGGLRTLSGGQYSFQIAGYLSIQTNAAPDINVETAHAVRDVFAIITEPAQTSGIALTVNLNGTSYCQLSFEAGATTSSIVNGLSLPALKSSDRLGVDVTAVGNSMPGTDLTVTIRL